jgi:hypothetical protein
MHCTCIGECVGPSSGLAMCDSLSSFFQHMLKEDDMFKDFAACSPSASITDEDSNVWP